MTVALVTGATQGLGLALVEDLAARLGDGDVVYLTGRNRQRVEQAFATLAPTHAEIRAEPLDVSSQESVDRTAESIFERHGSIDIVISNAYRRVLPTDRPAEVVDAYVETNNLGTTRMLRAFAPLMAERGTLLVVASTLGTLHYLAPILHSRFDDVDSLEQLDEVVLTWAEAVRDERLYAEAWPAFINIPSKVAQVAAVRTLARSRRDGDLERGVLLASVCPGMIDTGASRPWFDMSGAQTPQAAARPVIDLAFRERLQPELYGELVRFGRALPWKP